MQCLAKNPGDRCSIEDVGTILEEAEMGLLSSAILDANGSASVQREIDTSRRPAQCLQVEIV